MNDIKISDTDLTVSELLSSWYEEHKRTLPWRESADPYIIWISEIILQQTRVVQGMDYFYRFTERFPDVATLAEAHEDEVLKYWQGLGYYSRARNLHAAAKKIMTDFDGVFPSDYASVLSLKGIGEYTAAAIVSFAWNQPYPVVDGNVFRVLSRLFALETPIDTMKGKKQFTEIAGLILDPLHAATHNQAIMELGALQCVPKNPDCIHCPLQNQCMAFASGTVENYPVKQNKTKVRNRYFNYLHIVSNGQTWLSRRGEKDIWEGLYEFPLIETDNPLTPEELLEHPDFKNLLDGAEDIKVKVHISGLKHVLSHQVLFASFYTIEIKKAVSELSDYISVPLEDLEKYPVSRLIHIYLEKLETDLFE